MKIEWEPVHEQLERYRRQVAERIADSARDVTSGEFAFETDERGVVTSDPKAVEAEYGTVETPARPWAIASVLNVSGRLV